VDWYSQSIYEEAQHPLILISIFIAIFLAIHPFKDGNGRFSRVLTMLLLLRSGYGYVPYSSMKSIIEMNKDSYYLALRRTQKTIRTDMQNWEPWLIFFLKTMMKQKNNLSEKVKQEQTLRISLPALSRQILELVKMRGEVTVREIGDTTNANRNTIKVHLKNLTDQQYLIQLGKGRGVRYTLK
jgi:Fic family protein